jgi:hypothetical protein
MIPCYVDREGAREVDPPRHKDLLHLACVHPGLRRVSSIDHPAASNP